MTPQALKNSILQLAIQGKLVEQRPDEGIGKDLFQQIQAEKQLLIKAGKIKKEKPLPEVAEDEIPFDIPENWCWVRLADLVDIYTGKKDANFGSPDGEYNFFTCSNQPIRCRSYSYDGEYLIMPGNGANIGMVIQHTGKFEAYQRTYLLENVYGVFLDYLKYHLEANWKQYNADKMYGSAIPYIKLGNLTNYCVAFPPLAEQKRIVAKIEELLPLIDRYEQAWSKLEEFNKCFPVDMQKSILQLAIQGKLVDQKATDGSILDALELIRLKREELIKAGKLKKLGKINKTSEVDIEIPDTWSFVRLSEIICKRVDNRGKTPPHSLIKTKEHCIDLLEINSIVPGASINHDNVEKYIDEETYATLRGHIEANDILIATVGSIGKFAMMDDSRSAIAQNIIAIKCFGEVDQKYIFYLLQTPYFYASMGNITMEAVQASIKVPDLMNLRVPLPPLAEQKRIVAKLNEILPLCERLK